MNGIAAWLYLTTITQQLGMGVAAFAKHHPNHFMSSWSLWNGPSEPS